MVLLSKQDRPCWEFRALHTPNLSCFLFPLFFPLSLLMFVEIRDSFSRGNQTVKTQSHESSLSPLSFPLLGSGSASLHTSGPLARPPTTNTPRPSSFPSRHSYAAVFFLGSLPALHSLSVFLHLSLSASVSMCLSQAPPYQLALSLLSPTVLPSRLIQPFFCSTLGVSTGAASGQVCLQASTALGHCLGVCVRVCVRVLGGLAQCPDPPPVVKLTPFLLSRLDCCPD